MSKPYESGINMKKILLCISIAILAFCLASCEVDITKQVANKEQILNDISGIDSIKHCFKSDFVYESEYVCKDIEIVKRQINKDEKEDLVFVTATMENDYFNVTLDLSLTYNFYDEGGWILDENNWNVIDVKPIRVPEYTLVKEKISTYNTYGGINVEIPSHGTSYKTDKYSINNIAVENYDEYIYMAEYAHNTSDEKIHDEETRALVYFDVSFDYFEGVLETYLVFKDEGWKIPKANCLVLEDVVDMKDMSFMEGKYEYKSSPSLSDVLWVYDVDFENLMIECKYDYYALKDRTNYITRYGDRVVIKINPFDLIIKLDDLGKESSFCDELMYFPSNDCWKYRVSDYGHLYNELTRTADSQS